MTDIPPFLDRRSLVWSYTFLHTYESICPHQAYRRYIVRDIPFTQTEAVSYGNAVHDAMEKRVGSKVPLAPALVKYEPFAAPFDGREVKCELQLGVTKTGHATDFFAKDVWGRGKLDTVLQTKDSAYFLDWKTGNSKYESPFELELHAVLLHAKYPGLKKIVGQYAWLKENRLSEIYDLSHTGKTWGRINAIMSLIETDRKNGHFEKRQNPLCGWCPVKDCEFNRSPS